MKSQNHPFKYTFQNYFPIYFRVNYKFNPYYLLKIVGDLLKKHLKNGTNSVSSSSLRDEHNNRKTETKPK